MNDTDFDVQLNRREQNFSALNRNTTATIQHTLHTHYLYVSILTASRERWASENHKYISLCISEDSNLDRRVYDASTVSEVAVVMP